MSTHSTRQMTDWAEHFAQVFTELANGNADLHNLLDWAYDLYPQHGREDPAEVARHEFEAQQK